MRQCRWLAGAVLVGLLFLASGTARAERIVTQRTSGQKSSGARDDITVPYMTTGKTAFMQGYSAPRIYSSPQVDDPNNPQARPVYNLIFYGSKQGFGDKSNGAATRASMPLPNR
jgi:hypothetical protein